MPRIYTRSEWRAQYRDGVGTRPLGRLEKYLHHTVTKHLTVSASLEEEFAQMRVVEGIGQQRFGAGISYTFLIFPSGRIHEGASVHRISYHSGGGDVSTGPAVGRNTGGAGICLVGNYENQPMTAQQEASLVWLLREGVRRGWWGDPALTEAHRDFKGTQCPGRFAYARLAAINAIARSGAAATIPTIPTTSEEDDMPTAQEIALAVWGYKSKSINGDSDAYALLTSLARGGRSVRFIQREGTGPIYATDGLAKQGLPNQDVMGDFRKVWGDSPTISVSARTFDLLPDVDDLGSSVEAVKAAVTSVLAEVPLQGIDADAVAEAVAERFVGGIAIEGTLTASAGQEGV